MCREAWWVMYDCIHYPLFSFVISQQLVKPAASTVFPMSEWDLCSFIGAISENHTQQADRVLRRIWICWIHLSCISREGSASLQWNIDAKYRAAIPPELGIIWNWRETAWGRTWTLNLCWRLGSWCHRLHVARDFQDSLSLCEGSQGCNRCKHWALQGLWICEVWWGNGAESCHEWDEWCLLLYQADAN